MGKNCYPEISEISHLFFLIRVISLLFNGINEVRSYVLAITPTFDRKERKKVGLVGIFLISVRVLYWLFFLFLLKTSIVGGKV